MKSYIEKKLDERIIKRLSSKSPHNGKPLQVAKIMLNDLELQYMQEYANIVSIKRLNFNDHGPVHMRKVVINSLDMLDLLNKAGIMLNLEREKCGTYEDSIVAVILASFLHDLGMTIGRKNHENMSFALAIPVIDRILNEVYGDDLEKKVVIRSIALEGIIGHMATQKIHSLEAGIILVADGCDMEKGRARIPMRMSTESKVGDIHKYSAASIEKVKLSRGKKRAIKIMIEMKASVGFFQVEEVLFKKINISPVKSHIELYAGVKGREIKCYLS